MATDPATGNVVLYGGYVNGGGLTDTWLWNGVSWRQAQPPTSPPSRERLGAAMAADPATGTILWFGGSQPGETWTWDGRSETWTRHFPVPSPEGRVSHAMATDKSTNTVVLFGGAGGVGIGGVGTAGTRNDTWSWDGITKTWTEHTPATRPPARLYHMMAGDPATGTVVLFGGSPSHPGGHLGDTWTWNGSDWAQANPPTSPPARNLAYMSYHPPTRKVVLFGGGDGDKVRGDTWNWDGATRAWTKQTPADRPCSRASGSMAYHPGSRTAIIFGGTVEPPCPANTALSEKETWAWNGANWKRKA